MNATPDTGKWIAIGELSRLTGISTHTLRIWEKRYGTPKAHRLPSGHRRYPRDEVPRLRAVAQALESGFRAGRVVGATLEELQALLGIGPGRASRVSPAGAEDAASVSATRKLVLEKWMEAVHHYDEDSFTQGLHEEWGRHGAMTFVFDYAAPFLKRIGDAWSSGELNVSQEHFASERLSDFLADKWRTLNDRKEGPPVVLTTLPGETHRLGLLMCAVITSLTKLKIIYLGADTPLDDILNVVRQCEARMLGVSISTCVAPEDMQEGIARLKQGLPRDVALVTGGGGLQEEFPGVHHFSDFASYYDWLLEFTQSL